MSSTSKSRNFRDSQNICWKKSYNRPLTHEVVQQKDLSKSPKSKRKLASIVIMVTEDRTCSRLIKVTCKKTCQCNFRLTIL